MPGIPSRLERFERIGSTQDVVRAWLAEGTPEVCLAVASEQTAGRGRQGRTWVAPPGRALMLSAGFRPDWLVPDRVWRLAATVSLAMADAAEDHAGLRLRTIRLKWPNDLVVEGDGSAVARGPIRKLGGVLGESDGLGSDDPRVIIGIGVNADWPPAEFPPDLAAAMTSLRAISGGRPIDRDALLDAFVARLDARMEALRAGYFDLGEWIARQITTGRRVRIEHAGAPAEETLALGVDGQTGALVVEDASSPGGERAIVAGEITRIRIPGHIADNDGA